MMINGTSLENWIAADHNGNVGGKVGALNTGWDTINWYTELLNDGRRQVYLEVGTYDGIMISILAERFPRKTFIAVDPFLSAKGTAGGYLAYFIENNKMRDNVHLFIGPSQTVLADLLETVQRVDVALVDGEHRYATVLSDLLHLWCMAHPHQGIIGVHDFTMPDVAMAVSDFSRMRNLNYENLGHIVAFDLRKRE
jgi:hypothetical protein